MTASGVLGEVLMHLPECPEDVPRKYLQEAYEKVFTLSVFDTQTFEITTGQDKVVYDIDLTCGAKLGKLVECSDKGAKIVKGQLVLSHAPSANSKISLTVSVIPAEMPDTFDTQVLVDYALWKCHFIPQEKWTDFAKAVVHKREYYRLLRNVTSENDIKNKTTDTLNFGEVVF